MPDLRTLLTDAAGIPDRGDLDIAASTPEATAQEGTAREGTTVLDVPAEGEVSRPCSTTARRCSPSTAPARCASRRAPSRRGVLPHPP